MLLQFGKNFAGMVRHWHYVAAAALALALFFFIYPVAFLTGDAALFSNGDASQAVAGWWYYAADTWRFPVFKTDRLLSPEGVSVIYTDSIPLMAFLFKPFAHLLPSHFHYFGIWHLFCYLFQALGAGFLARSMRAPKWSVPFVAFFAVVFPAFLLRIGHTSLLTHGLILCALGLYFSVRNGCLSLRQAHAIFYGLQVASLLIHPYFFPMVSAVWLAMMVDRWEDNGKWKGLLLRLAVGAVAVLSLFFILGFVQGNTRTIGFGIYSTNLWAPFVGGKFTPPFIDATSGQCEGFNYMGLGGLAAIFLAIGARGREILASSRTMIALIAVVIVMAVYSFSNHVYAGKIEVLTWPDCFDIQRITGTFRASGRFFWPFGYLVLLSSIVIVTRMRTRVAFFGLTALCALQWSDLAEIRASVRNRVSARAETPPPASKVILSGVSLVASSPCVIGDTAENNEFVLRMHYLCGYFGVPYSGGYVSRGDSLFGSDALEKACLVVIPRTLVHSSGNEVSPVAKSLLKAGGFRVVDDLLVLRRDWTDDNWRDRFPSAKPYSYGEDWPLLSCGRAVGPGSREIEWSSGWSVSEGTHRWTSGVRSAFSFRCEDRNAKRILIKFSTLGHQRIAVKLNGIPVYEGSHGADKSPHSLTIGLVKPLEGITRLEFDLPDACAPNAADTRILALALHEIRVE